MSELISVICRVGGASGGVGEAGDAELDGVGAAGADLVHLGEFGVSTGEADLKTLGLAYQRWDSASAMRASRLSRISSSRRLAAGSGRSSGQRRQLCSWTQGVS